MLIIYFFDSGDYIDSNNNKGSEYIWDNPETIVNSTIQQARDDKWFNSINGLTGSSNGWTVEQWSNISDIDPNIRNIEWRRRRKLKLSLSKNINGNKFDNFEIEFYTGFWNYPNMRIKILFVNTNNTTMDLKF